MKALIFTLLVLLPANASAYIITVDFVDYDITTTTGTYAAVESTLILQDWYNDNSLAYALADEVEAGMGYPNLIPGGAEWSPLFVVGTGNPSSWQAWASILGNGSPGAIGGAITETVYTFAVTQAVPEPGTATLVMVGLIGLAGARRKVSRVEV